ncbi:type IV secretory system conjugative DNA transfer family protein [Paenarthrobacter aurescens]|jgi:type IV secretory pathway TraG/TraD family ATPase VirD4|uniref:TraG-family protein n=2 Tax=Paenarthrobacter aurescens TaxID=43663 RepID=Q6SK19_PAEAU|nr:TraM recognition domain-containing protein [Paenarthrobacter aurescens]AAS20153.1 TraG-family protein [Paenarthrobacter aurescens]ABM10535.1 putative TraG-family protein [Paenarthrobacter aurescens TC1]
MSQPTSTDTLLKLILAGTVAGLLALAWVSAFLGELLTPTGMPWTSIPMLVARFKEGSFQWPTAATWILIVLAVIGFLGAAFLASRGGGRGSASQRALAGRLASGSRLSSLTEKHRARETRQLHPDADNLPPGQKLGYTLAGKRQLLFSGYRQTGLSIVPPGGGKTSACVIPRMAGAPGPALMTSNKIDGVPEVIAARHRLGRIWIFDPNGIYRAADRPDFTFNPLSLIKDTVTAMELASVIITAAKKNNPRDGDGKDDAHFGPAGETCLAWALLAAAAEKKPLSAVHEWMARGDLVRIKDILEDAGYDSAAADMFGFSKWPDRTKGSLIATTQRMCRDLSHSTFRDWTTPAPGIDEFDPKKFLNSKDTLILLSERRPGGTGAVITAIVKSITTAARNQAPGAARLRVPLVAELDEVANIVPWPSLPEDFSYFGSLGLCFTVYLQAYAQGVGEWGENGMRTLWQTAGFRLVGANEETAFTRGLSETIGTWEKEMGKDRPTKTLPKAGPEDFANLPGFTAFLFSAGAPATLISLFPWFKDKQLSATIKEGLPAAGEPAQTKPASPVPVQTRASEDATP